MDMTLLDSSPPDGTTLRFSNTALCIAVNSLQALTETACRYISRLTETSERLEAKNAILCKEKADKDTVLQKRKAVKTGKRLVLKGVVLVSTSEFRDKVKAAEAESAAKAKSKGIVVLLATYGGKNE